MPRRRWVGVAVVLVLATACGPDLSEVPMRDPDDSPRSDEVPDLGSSEDDLAAELGPPADAVTTHGVTDGVGVAVPEGYDGDTFALLDGVVQLGHRDGSQEVLAVGAVDQREGSEWADLDFDAATARAATLIDDGARLEGEVTVDGASRARGFVYDLPDDGGEQLLVLAEAPSGLALFIYLGVEGAFDDATAALVLSSATVAAEVP